ncbi:MAG TPA: glycosyltransferase family 4 protein [Vicinamibacterales bacterium]|nr:glycosyltransferase family 4 protein [Vicinamibacterales bacterium]HPW21638.1 glycosyltransferase family 4 protein [Vicinamibacterales bacterium]
MRIAWFSPLPPDRSGIAAYSADVLAGLRGHEIDAFVDDTSGQDAVLRARPLAGASIRGAHEFVWRRARRPYDVVVYQLGNSAAHDYLWPYLVRYPGLVVLHDAQLHQSRARALIRQFREDDYKAEFRYSYPGVPPLLADLVVAGLGATLCYFWPMVQIPVESARTVAVHNAHLASALRGRFPGCDIVRIHMGVPDPGVPPGAAAGVRRRHGIPEDAVVFGSFGRVTPEKGLTAVVRALAHVAPSVPNLRLLTVGEPVEYYDLMAQARELGVADAVVSAGYVGDGELASYLAATDVCLNLRWPTGRETSAAWLRCVAAGKPTIVTDLAHQTDVPSLDVRTMAAAPGGPAGAEPVCLHIELVDEIPMLRLALQRLCADAGLRERLGRAARRYWEQHATVGLMVRDYEGLLARAAAAPDPPRPPAWPAHLAADGSARARALAAEAGVPYPLAAGPGSPESSGRA